MQTDETITDDVLKAHDLTRFTPNVSSFTVLSGLGVSFGNAGSATQSGSCQVRWTAASHAAAGVVWAPTRWAAPW